MPYRVESLVLAALRLKTEVDGNSLTEGDAAKVPTSDNGVGSCVKAIQYRSLDRKQC